LRGIAKNAYTGFCAIAIAVAALVPCRRRRRRRRLFLLLILVAAQHIDRIDPRTGSPTEQLLKKLPRRVYECLR
jgi:hypothetical protein